MRQSAMRAAHVLALGLWFGGAAFFNFVTAPTIFEAFKQVVHGGPSDRTAYQPITTADATKKQKDALAGALAGAAVGPVFPKYFATQAGCGVVALATALAWRNAGGRVHRLRVYVIGLAVLTVAAAWPVSDAVTALRLRRFDPDAAVADAATAAFAAWHLASLLLSFVTVALAGVALAMAARLPVPENDRTEPATADPPSW